MNIEGNYSAEGFALLRGCISANVATALMKRIQKDMKVRFVARDARPATSILPRAAFEVHGNDYPPLQTFLWGLTGVMEHVTGRPLLPTYDYFRLYQEGDICRVHRDRPACEHSLSLTLAYADGIPWPLELAMSRSDVSHAKVSDDFGDEPYASLSMEVGDAVAYRGVEHRHARTRPNPNRWSAHLFLHWVEREGPHADQAFDRQVHAGEVDFTFY